jgi:hypothetical protein
MGAIDLAEIDQEPVVTNTLATVANSTLQAAATVVREAAPRFIETIIQHLLPDFPVQSEVTADLSPHSPGVTSGPSPIQYQSPVTSSPPSVIVSPPVETVIILPASNNVSYPTIPTSHDTVQINPCFNLFYTHCLVYLILISHDIEVINLLGPHPRMCSGNCHILFLSGVGVGRSCLGPVQG